MSRYKHLADLLKICSVLPALAVMPAFATVDITEGQVIENQTNNDGANQNAAGLTITYGDSLTTSGVNNVTLLTPVVLRESPYVIVNPAALLLAPSLFV